MRSLFLSAVASASLAITAGTALGADYAASDESVVGTGWYAGIFGGASWADEIEFEDDGEDALEMDLDRGFTVGGMFGLHFADSFRADLEVSYADYDIDDCEAITIKCAGTGGDISAFYALANLWFDFDLGVFSPYVGGGVGAGKVEIDSPTIDDSEWGFAFQAGAGVRLGLGDTVVVDAGYRFKGIPDVELDSFDSEFYSHNAQLGLILEF